jgi:hypothetical protein
LRDSKVVIIGFLVIVAGWVFQITGSVLSGNAGAVLQLTGTLFITVGTAILAIGSLKFIEELNDTSTLNRNNRI